MSDNTQNVQNKRNLYFIGARHFCSKSGKECFVLSFLTPKVDLKEGFFTKQVDIFTTEEKYRQVLKNVQFLGLVECSFDIVGDNVRYSI